MTHSVSDNFRCSKQFLSFHTALSVTFIKRAKKKSNVNNKYIWTNIWNYVADKNTTNTTEECVLVFSCKATHVRLSDDGVL